MPKFYSSSAIIKVLLKQGFICISQKGSHIKFRKSGNPRTERAEQSSYDGSPTLTVIVPADKKEIPFGTFRSILRQANLTEDDFKRK